MSAHLCPQLLLLIISSFFPIYFTVNHYFIYHLPTLSSSSIMSPVNSLQSRWGWNTNQELSKRLGDCLCKHVCASTIEKKWQGAQEQQVVKINDSTKKELQQKQQKEKSYKHIHNPGFPAAISNLYCARNDNSKPVYMSARTTAGSRNRSIIFI